MNIKIRRDNKAELVMKHQIGDRVSKFKDIFDIRATSPCAHCLWDVNNEALLLDDVKAGFIK